jgi:polyhydroxybutyrate depolymerase
LKEFFKNLTRSEHIWRCFCYIQEAQHKGEIMRTRLFPHLNLLMAMFVMASLAVVFTPAAPTYAQGSLKPGLGNYSIAVGKTERTFIGYVPRPFDATQKYPVVIMLHGYGGNGKNALEQGKWVEKAEKEKFIVLGLDGTRENNNKRDNILTNPQSWNSGSGDTAAELKDIDDVGFVRGVIDWIVKLGNADPDRIYVAGFSNGAGMTFRVGAELSDLVAAIAPVSNGLFVDVEKLDRPTSLLMIWGTADPLNPYNGGTVNRFGIKSTRASAEDSFKVWADLLNCPDKPQTLLDRNEVKARVYRPCDKGSEAVFYTIEGMGHHWPSGRSFLPQAIVGKPSEAIDATDVIWAFFVKHPRTAKP